MRTQPLIHSSSSSSFSSSNGSNRFATTRTTTRTIAAAWILAFAVILTGCSRQSANEVVIYCSVDQMHAEPILKEFEKKTGIRVKAVYDSEAVKSVGLVNRLRAEAKHPQADVFWNNETARTMQLHLAKVVGKTGHIAARARVIVYNTNLVKPDQAPRSIFDLADPKWRGKVAMGYPLFGTTSTHAGGLFAALGVEKAETYYRALKDNKVRIFEGNSVACEQVAQGHCLVGMTDTDDVWERKSKGLPVEMIYPDQSPSPSTLNPRSSAPLGCFVIPNAVSIVKGGPHSEAAQQLFDYLHSRETEQKLAFGPSRQMPMLGAKTPVPEGVKRVSELKVMQVEDDVLAESMPGAAEFLGKLFSR